MHRANRVAISAALVLAACSASAPTDGKGGGGDSAAPIALADACEAIGQAVCESYVACGLLGTESVPFCREDLLNCEAFLVGERVEAGAMAYDGAALRRCVGKLAAAPCVNEAWYSVFRVDADCRAAFRGQLPDDAECDDDMACASGRCGGECPRRCLAAGALGATCASGHPFCAAHLGCVDGVCSELPARGQGCTQDWEPDGLYGRCAPGLVCDATGTCRAYATGGEDCGVPCDLRWICVDGTCISRGEAGTSCEENYECRTDLRCASGSCVPRIPAGGDCSASWEDEFGCAAGLRCLSSGVCGRPLPMGSSCDEESDECRDWCESGICAAEVGPGEACDDVTTFCWAGPCVDGVCTEECHEW